MKDYRSNSNFQNKILPTNFKKSANFETTAHLTLSQYNLPEMQKFDNSLVKRNDSQTKYKNNSSQLTKKQIGYSRGILDLNMLNSIESVKRNGSIKISKSKFQKNVIKFEENISLLKLTSNKDKSQDRSPIRANRKLNTDSSDHRYSPKHKKLTNNQ